MTYFLAAFAFVCLVFALWLLRDRERERLREERNTFMREAQQWAKLYWDLRDDTPARGSDGKFTPRGK